MLLGGQGFLCYMPLYPQHVEQFITFLLSESVSLSILEVAFTKTYLLHHFPTLAKNVIHFFPQLCGFIHRNSSLKMYGAGGGTPVVELLA
jgi:hypothetical protein